MTTMHAARDVVLRALARLTAQPACLKPLSQGQRISFGAVNVKPAGAAGLGGPVVVWIECARSPVPRYPIVTPKASGPP
jgi:hypothetical protein